MHINTSRLFEPNQYFPDRHKKEAVILHFTAGMTAKSAIDTLAGSVKRLGYPLATPWVVETDGTIYKLYDDDCWAYNIGIPKAQSKRHHQDKRTVAIEIVNVGPLRRVGNALCWWAKNFTVPYCDVSQTDLYIEEDYRGEKYWATYSHEQVVSVANLVDDICGRFDIDKRLAPSNKRHQFDLEYYWDFRGVVQHVNFRKDKYDLGPGGEPFFQELISRGYKEEAPGK